MPRDMTRGSVWKTLLLFALPMMGSQLLQVTYSVVDAIVVGNFVSANALGAVSIPGPIIWIMSSIAAGMGAGANIVVAQFYGAKRQEDVQRSAATAVLFCTLLGAGVTLFCMATARPLIWGLLQTPPEMRELSLSYLMVYSVGLLFQMLYQACYGVLRAFGDSKASLIFLLIAAVLNVVLDLIFVAGLGWGVKGAAAASVIAQIGSALASLFYLLWRLPYLRGGRAIWRLEGEKLRLLLRVSIPVTVQMVVQAGGFLLLQRMVNSFGPASIEGFASMGKTEEIMHVPVNCFATAIASFVGQNMGAGDTERAGRGYREALKMALIVSVVLGVGILLLDEQVLRLFNITGESLLRGREHLDIMCLMLPVFTVQQITNGALQGAGDVRVPVISSFTDLILRLAGTWLLSFTALSFRCIYLSTPPAWIAACAISVIWYRKGHWKHKGLLGPD